MRRFALFTLILLSTAGFTWAGPGPANTTFDLGSSEYTWDAANLSVLPSVLTLGGFADSCVGLCRTDECDEGGHEFFQTVWNQHTGNDPHPCGNQAICSEANGHESCYEGSMRLDPEVLQRVLDPNMMRGQELWQTLQENAGSGFSVSKARMALQRLSCDGTGAIAVHIPLNVDVLEGFLIAEQDSQQ